MDHRSVFPPRRLIGGLFILTVAWFALGAARHTVEELDAQRYLDHVKFLASDALRGRATGSPELEKAAAYIVKQFKSAGLQPFDGKSYLQAFPVTTNAKIGPNNHFDYTQDGKTKSLKFEEDFIPFNFSCSSFIRGAYFCAFFILRDDCHLSGKKRE